MKISLIIPSFYPAVIYGGPIFSTLHTCQELAKLEDVEVYVSTTNANITTRLDVQTNKWTKFEENFFVKYYDETKVNKFSWQLFCNIWKDIKQAEIISIQTVFDTPAPISLLYAKCFRKPIVLSPRGALCHWCVNQGSRFKQFWLKYLIKPFVKNIYFHATCEAEKQDILTIFPDAKIVIIPNGVDVDSYHKNNILNKQEYIKKYVKADIESNNIIVSMSRLHAKKGFDILIQAFAEVLQTYPESILLIAGPDEGEKQNLENLINALELNNRIYLIGPMNGQDKVDFLANADLFVLPSHNENFGNVYIESLAAGTPIVASTGTPWQEVESADCGKWVDNTIEDTASAMLEMLEKDREQMRLNARILAQKYDWKNIALQFKDVFEKIVETK
ncbi:MAG TPA: glycosyltransferase [Epsilonproteobacteria bacterium]|nr:glycosyltransferase [Campylobacterota bacterium]